MGDWIQGAVRNQGALHRALGIPEDQPIPRSKLEQAKHSWSVVLGPLSVVRFAG
jgi:hypothetical protein